MRGLRGLINERKRTSNLTTPTSSNERILTKPSEETINEDTNLRHLASYYSHVPIHKKRERDQQEDISQLRLPKRGCQGQTAADRSLREATSVLEKYHEPLKLYGETSDDVVLRAHHVMSTKLEGHVYRCVSDIDISQSPNFIISSFIKTCLSLWGERIIGSSKTNESRRLYESSQKAVEPLIKLIRTDTLNPDIKEKMSQIATCCVKQNYKEAHALYLSLAIGNSAWPMGVTMVGIHERVGRSRIAASEIVHILNDDVTCKYVQVIKRFITLCQSTL